MECQGQYSEQEACINKETPLFTSCFRCNTSQELQSSVTKKSLSEMLDKWTLEVLEFIPILSCFPLLHSLSGRSLPGLQEPRVYLYLQTTNYGFLHKTWFKSYLKLLAHNDPAIFLSFMRNPSVCFQFETSQLPMQHHKLFPSSNASLHFQLPDDIAVMSLFHLTKHEGDEMLVDTSFQSF